MVSLLEYCMAGDRSGISVLRGFRLLRIFKLIRKWKNMHDLMIMVVNSAHEAMILGQLILLFIFINGLMGKQLFGGDLYDPDGEI
jgi:hypothetical protein